MPQLSFETDWVDAEGINGPELSATWASLRIRAGDATITRVLDTRAKRFATLCTSRFTRWRSGWPRTGGF